MFIDYFSYWITYNVIDSLNLDSVSINYRISVKYLDGDSDSSVFSQNVTMNNSIFRQSVDVALLYSDNNSINSKGFVG